MKFPQLWRPTNGTPKQLAKIEQLEAIAARQEEANAREIADLTERLRDAEESLTITLGLCGASDVAGLKEKVAERQAFIHAKLAERQAFIHAQEADIRALDATRAELEAEISNIRRSVPLQAVCIAASAGVSEPLNIEGGADGLTLYARYQELKATNPKAARDFWAKHHEQITNEIQNS